MTFFDQVYDEMSLQQVCTRLPGELAISAVKRRITNIDTLKMFFDNIGSKQPNNISELKNHINDLISGIELDDIFNTFGENYHPVLFGWLNDKNTIRLRDYDTEKLSLKFLFNIAKSDDEKILTSIMHRVLNEDFDLSKVRAVLRKADDKCLHPLIEMLVKDKRPEVRSMILCIPGLTNNELIGDFQKTIGLKAFAKCPDDHLPIINMLDMNLFKSLRPLERITALEKYLKFFPLYNRVNVFTTVPTEEEFKLILFAGCLNYNERVNNINILYNKITSEDPPEDNDEN